MVIFFVIVAVVAIVLQRISLRNAAKKDNILYSCKPSVPGCEPDEEFTVFSTITNLSVRPSPVLRIEERFPKQLNIASSHDFNVKVSGDHRIFVSTATIRGRQRVKRYLTASIGRRGEYCFSFAEFHAGDFLGFNEVDYFKDNREFIVIYPHLIENADFLKTFTDTFDSIAMRRRLLEDPISVRGYRDYTGREPMRAISFKQSAVRNRLIAKEYDPTWQESVTIILDTQYHGKYDFHVRRQEFCFSAARTVCEALEERGLEYRLVTNAIISDGISSFYSPGGKGPAYRKILYGLGSAKNGETCSVGELISSTCTGSLREKTVIFIATRRNAEVNSALSRLKRSMGTDVVEVFAEDCDIDAFVPDIGEKGEKYE